MVPKGCLNITLLQVLGRTVCKIACINTLFSDHKGALTPSQVELQRHNTTQGSSSKQGVKTKFEACLLVLRYPDSSVHELAIMAFCQMPMSVVRAPKGKCCKLLQKIKLDFGTFLSLFLWPFGMGDGGN